MELYIPKTSIFSSWARNDGLNSRANAHEITAVGSREVRADPIVALACASVDPISVRADPISDLLDPCS
eukprot:7201598-Pyramimonas_sp.AAC.1